MQKLGNEVHKREQDGCIFAEQATGKDGNPVPTACSRLSEYADSRTLTGLKTEYLFSLAEETSSVGILSFLERAGKKAEYESACNDSERVALICPNVEIFSFFFREKKTSGSAMKKLGCEWLFTNAGANQRD